MPDILVRNIPEKLKKKLKQQAKNHHRSVGKEIYAILEENLREKNKVREEPVTYKGAFKITNKFINDAKQNGRN